MEERESFARWVKVVCIDRVDSSRSWLEGANVVGKILRRNSPIQNIPLATDRVLFFGSSLEETGWVELFGTATIDKGHLIFHRWALDLGMIWKTYLVKEVLDQGEGTSSPSLDDILS